MMHKSQICKIDAYDWFCAPESHIHRNTAELFDDTERERRMGGVPEREDDEACDDEDRSKQDEDVVACVLPSGVVKHLS